MRKLGVIVLFFILLISSISIGLAQDNSEEEITETEIPETNEVDEAYQCLQGIIDEKETSSLSLEEAIFSTLALGSQQKLKDKIEQEKGNDCWPSSSCKLKKTAQALLAYQRIDKNSEDIESYLLAKKETSTDLAWFLQIDIQNHVYSTCTLSYESTVKTVNINEDMTVSGNPGTCFSISSSGYGLLIKNLCLDKTFEISCDAYFVTSLVYRKSGSETLYISPESHSAPSETPTTELVKSKCFKTGNACNYEGTLWSALALQSAGEDMSDTLPYLLALAEDNQKYFPSSFLFLLTNGDDQYNQLVQSQKQEQYWQAPGSGNKFYDTALAMLSLQGTSATELENSRNYLLGIKTSTGCWNNNNLRDTAFILYSGWPKTVTVSSSGDISDACGPAGSCQSAFSCSDAGGDELIGRSCPTPRICCSVEPTIESCSEKSGEICSAGEDCSGSEVQSSEGSCCLGECKEIEEILNPCADIGGSCYESCLDSEIEDDSVSCPNSEDICCTPSEEKSTNWTLIIILTSLIILVMAGIIFRKKLKSLFSKFRKKGGDRPPAPIRGRRPPRPPFRRMPMRRPSPRRMPTQQIPVRQVAKMDKQDKEFDETLKKLKEMSN